jgi:hypothetical protein
MLFSRRRSRRRTPAAFYVALALGFVAIAVAGAVRGDWLVMALAAVMIVVALAAMRVMRVFAPSIDAAAAERSAKEETHE